MSANKKIGDTSNTSQDAIYSRRNPTSSSRSSATSVETIVTKLLMSTKHLLQTLTQWSRKVCSERAVSDAYVQLGNDFKVVSKFFNHCGIDVQDLGDVPLDLRRVLEVALRDQPSDDNLNKYLPTIREIIVTLLDKLKVKQALLKTVKQEQLKKTQHQQRPSIVSSLSLSSVSTPTHSANPSVVSAPAKVPTVPKPDIIENVEMHNKDKPRTEYLTPTQPTRQRTLSETEALSRLKNGTNLQRRASKRFSAYHMAKFTNQSTADAAATAVDSINGSSQSNPLPTTIATNTIENNSDVLSKEDQPMLKSQTISQSTNDTLHTLFLSMDGRIKKCHVPIPSNMNALRLLFVEKFAFSPGGETFPLIYMKDPEYSVFYELEEQGLPEIHDGCIIELRQTHQAGSDSTISDMLALVKGEISKSQEDILSQIRDLTLKSQQSTLPPTAVEKRPVPKSLLTADNLREMKQELSVLRQLQKENKKSVEDTIATITDKLAKFRYTSLKSAASSNRVYMDKSQTQLGEVSDALLSRVDDLQDLIEIMRKDVAVRGVKPSRKKLDSLQKDLNAARHDLGNMKEYIATEKPHWKRIWEAELDKVCEEQQFLTLQEDLATDLEEDLGKALETFDLVNLCCTEQEKNPKRSKTNPILPIPKPGTLNMVREQLLVEVQSVNPDHEGRVEALEKAEKLWEKEREYRDNGEFEEELETFVEKSSFKRSGGVEEVERLRKQKDEENLRATFGGM